MNRVREASEPRLGHATLNAAFDRALHLVHDFHRMDVREGTAIPYFSHLLQVAGLVTEAGGDEEQAIAALLHDAVEDAYTQAEAEARIKRIRAEFGDWVAALVLDCTDGRPDEKAATMARHEEPVPLHHLHGDAGADALLISVADKLHKARAILRDHRAHGEELWKRFRGASRERSGTTASL